MVCELLRKANQNLVTANCKSSQSNRKTEVLTGASAGRVYESEHQPSNAIMQFRKLLKRDRDYTHNDYSIPIGSRYHPERAVMGAGFTGRDDRRMDRTRQHPESKRGELRGRRVVASGNFQPAN